MDYKSLLLQIADTFSKEHNDICSSKVSWFEGAVDALSNWNNLSLSEEEVKNLLNLDYQDFKINTDPRICEIRETMFALIAFCDSKASDKTKYNPQKHTLASCGLRQNVWVRYLLNSKLPDIQLQTNIQNLFDYIKDPINNTTFYKEEHKQLVVENLLEKEYNRDTFNDDFTQIFDGINVSCSCPENLGFIRTCIVYDDQLRALWQPKEEKPLDVAPVIKAISNDDRMALYRDFLTNCIPSSKDISKASNSVDNYSDFKRINEWVKTKHPDFQGVISIDKESKAKKLYDELDSWPEMPDKRKPHEKFKQIGGGQYHNAILMYIRFLHAIELCAQLSEFRAKSGVDKNKVASYDKYLTALRTKPFLLLAGISGTGKSRIVREMAYKSCPDEGDLRADSTTPGNYLMVEVKPNWHDSSELLGYYSNISKKYMLTPFIKFLVNAKKYPNVPFFVCLDEMNLAPVEQYFAEFLSVLETRRMTDKGIKSGVLVKKEHLIELGETEDLTLPQNVFIVGTVNMDDTTHQFSRKVIDRAMTIEMNGGNLEDMFGHSNNLEYAADVWTMDKELLTQYVNADEVNDKHQLWAEKIKAVLPAKLNKINDCLKNTPFEVSYRVLNELCIYLGVLLDDEDESKLDDARFDELVKQAVDQILLMKILPRIEGDTEMFNLSHEEIEENNLTGISNKLNWLESVAPNVTYADDSMNSKKKLQEMIGRMNSGFTRFWP